MHVSSNPFFAFHDDVFPNFAKNTVAKIRNFTQSATSLSPPYPLPIIPDFPFVSFDKELFHISSFELDFTKTRKLHLELKKRDSIKVSEKQSSKDPKKTFHWKKIMEFRSYNEKSIFEFLNDENSSIKIASDFFEGTIVLENLFSLYWTTIEIAFEVKGASFLFFVVKKDDKEIARKNMEKLKTAKEKRIRVLKFDDVSEIKNVFFFQNRPSQIHLILLADSKKLPEQYALSGDGFKNGNAKISIPKQFEFHLVQTKPALVNGRLHLFGAYLDRKIVFSHRFNRF